MVAVVAILVAVTAGQLAYIIGLHRHLARRELRWREVDMFGRLDPLTGLANRADLMRTLESALREQTDMDAYLVDLDGFKDVNDTWGHPVGDTVLATVAGRLWTALGAEAAVGRLGGDEFLVLERAGTARFVQVAAEVFALPVTTATGERVLIGASVGQGRLLGRRTPQEVLSTVDRALYAAKHRIGRADDTGRGRVVLATPAPDGWVLHRLAPASAQNGTVAPVAADGPRCVGPRSDLA